MIKHICSVQYMWLLQAHLWPGAIMSFPLVVRVAAVLQRLHKRSQNFYSRLAAATDWRLCGYFMVMTRLQEVATRGQETYVT